MTDPTDDPARRTDRRSDTVSPRLVVGIVLAILALVFVFQNTGKGRVNFLFWRFDAPAWTWLVLIFVVGVVVGSIFPWFRRNRRR